MPLRTVALGAALTPTVVAACFSHYIHRKERHKKPTVHLSYDESLHIIRAFLRYVSKYPVEDLQAFSSQWVPSPHWVKTDPVTIAVEHLESAAKAINDQLGERGIARVGGQGWWQWRGPAGELKGEWIEMRAHYHERMERGDERGNRVMLYIHGGAYFFGSVETHRYQLQRHARKLRGRVFAPEYRLSPQFPFPCSLQDCLAAYLFLLTTHEPKEIIFAGDSAGGGLVLSMLVIIRDQGLPLPAGAILISPWVDLTHSFPSIVKDNPLDYIPPYGFRHRPSEAWPPPNADEILELRRSATEHKAMEAKEIQDVAVPKEKSKAAETAARGYTVHHQGVMDEEQQHRRPIAAPSHNSPTANVIADNLKVVIDGETVEIKDQIQMYATNQLMSHPLVSPVLQPSLGGLPPLQVLSGSGEMLRDEQFYLAHKAANPTAYPPSDAYLDENDPDREILHKYGPTYVQLQVWDDLCHVAPTLSFTRPAKYMYRSIAQFGAWALARAQDSAIDIMDDDDISEISDSGPDSPGPSSSSTEILPRRLSFKPGAPVGRAGDPLPAFQNHMVRQRVDKNGHVYPLPVPSSCPVLQIPPSQIGTINPLLVKKWLAAKTEWDERYAHDKLRVQRHRLRELERGLEEFEGEQPPPSALAARRAAPGVLPKMRGKKNYGMMLWTNWGSKHDEKTIERERAAERRSARNSVDSRPASSRTEEKNKKTPPPVLRGKRSGSIGQNRMVSDAGQADNTTDGESFLQPSRREDNQEGAEEERPSSPFLGLGLLGPTISLNNLDEGAKLPPENPSTIALVHADGTIPRLVRTSSESPGHDDGASLDDEGRDRDRGVDRDRDSLTIRSAATGNLSTVAVINQRGIVGRVGGGDGRPEMPERDRFLTAQEYQ